MAATRVLTKPAAKTVAATKAKTSKGPEAQAEERFHEAREASIMLKHISDATRLQVILLLSESEKHVGALCTELNQSQPAVSHHLALMRHGGVITPRRMGKNNYYRLTEAGEQLAEIVKQLVEE